MASRLFPCLEFRYYHSYRSVRQYMKEFHRTLTSTLGYTDSIKWSYNTFLKTHWANQISLWQHHKYSIKFKYIYVSVHMNNLISAIKYYTEKVNFQIFSIFCSSLLLISLRLTVQRLFVKYLKMWTWHNEYKVYFFFIKLNFTVNF